MGVWLLAYGLMLGVMAFQIRHIAKTRGGVTRGTLVIMGSPGPAPQ